jgi:hypothetical protein
MFSPGTWTVRLLRALRQQPLALSTTIAPYLDPFQPLEEEKTPYYDLNRFYPARLGEVLNGRYQIATKIGYGASSTVWLARDLHQFVLPFS